MNGNVKFHKANGPAFAKGEVWVSANGINCTIDRVENYGCDTWDWDVYYTFSDGSSSCKNVWSFQVRYQHQADIRLKSKYC